MHQAELMARDREYVANTYSRFPVALISGSGARCLDADGKQYIDLTSGIGVNSLGFCDPGWVKAVVEQAQSLQHCSNLYYTEPCGQLAQTLCLRTGAKKVFFGNSGAEANEGMIKAARKYSFEKYGSGRSTIVTLVNSFHGRTVTTLAATGQEVFHQYFYPFTEGFLYARANDAEQTLAMLAEPGVCAVMMELVQGEGGVIALEKAYVDAVADYCAANDILLLVDEVQTGVGRTGTLFAYEQYGVKPDAVSCAKGLGSGLPIGGVLFFDKTEFVFKSGDHATTFGANPVCCAAANAVMARLTEDFLDEVQEKGAWSREQLIKMPHVQSVSGLGMMIGVGFDDGISAKDVVARCIDNGLLTLTAKAKLRLLPPLTVTPQELSEAMEILNNTLTSMS